MALGCSNLSGAELDLVEPKRRVVKLGDHHVEPRATMNVRRDQPRRVLDHERLGNHVARLTGPTTRRQRRNVRPNRTAIQPFALVGDSIVPARSTAPPRVPRLLRSVASQLEPQAERTPPQVGEVARVDLEVRIACRHGNPLSSSYATRGGAPRTRTLSTRPRSRTLQLVPTRGLIRQEEAPRWCPRSGPRVAPIISPDSISRTSTRRWEARRTDAGLRFLPSFGLPSFRFARLSGRFP